MGTRTGNLRLRSFPTVKKVPEGREVSILYNLAERKIGQVKFNGHLVIKLHRLSLAMETMMYFPFFVKIRLFF